MGQVNTDTVLFAKKILSQFVVDHAQDDGEIGRVVSAISIITPILEDYSDKG